MLIFSENLLTFTELDIAEVLKEKFIFTIFPLDATIQDSNIKERSNNLIQGSFF